ncbi:MAG: GNAT family N-acetyltransferase [Alphaproteobacteria bacterium]|nr:GNAT family N-acetyltransferase [Alphaproteobacteria bacterium]
MIHSGLIEASARDGAKSSAEIRNLTTRHEMDELRLLFEGVGFYKPEGYYERCLEEQAEGRRIIYGANLDGVLVGYCMLNWKPKYHFFRKFGIPEIQDLNVVPIYRRKGVAKALIANCEQVAKGRGHEQMGIGVGLLSDYGPAQRLYARLGYIPDGCGVTYDRNPVVHGEFRPIDDDLCLMMVKDI